jgi:D-alanyl-D-alanine carboxypeptidase
LHSINNNEMTINEVSINNIVEKHVDNKRFFSTLVCVSKGSETKTFAAGNIQTDSQYFIASITKLYTTSVILKLKDEGRLELNDNISKYISSDILDNIHVYKDIDYSNNITIKHLLSHTSGLPDYFEQKRSNGLSLKDELFKGNDLKLSFNDAIKISKDLPPKFPPGKKGKAFYSDTNFQLLGRIIEIISQQTIELAFINYIFTPLELKSTYLYTDITDTKPVDFYNKNEILKLPKIMSSFGPDGAIVSTAKESMIFLKAFFNGKLFSKDNFSMMKDWNTIFFPFKYGLGLTRFKFIGTYELIGHSGASGSFAYYCPKKDAYIAGTTNQAAKPSAPFQLMLKILKTLK